MNAPFRSFWGATRIQRIAQVVALVVALLTYVVGVWGSTNQRLLAEPASPHGISWITVPIARFLMQVTNNGEGIYLAMMAWIMGMVTFCLFALVDIQIAKRRR